MKQQAGLSLSACGLIYVLFNPKNGGSIFLWKVTDILSDYTTSQPLLWEFQIQNTLFISSNKFAQLRKSCCADQQEDNIIKDLIWSWRNLLSSDNWISIVTRLRAERSRNQGSISSRRTEFPFLYRVENGPRVNPLSYPRDKAAGV
jgi:hypothetical protein